MPIDFFATWTPPLVFGKTYLFLYQVVLDYASRSLEVKPGRTTYVPTHPTRLRSIAILTHDPHMKTSRVSLRIFTQDTQAVICTLTSEINCTTVNIAFTVGTELSFDVTGDCTLVLSGNEFRGTQESISSPPTSTIALADPMVTGETTARKTPAHPVYIDHIKGTGPSVGFASTVAFWYIVRRAQDSVIVQRNDNRAYPAVADLRDQKNIMPALRGAIVGMREGGERHVQVPAHLGKGSTPIGGLKSNDDFFLYLKVIKVFDKPEL